MSDSQDFSHGEGEDVVDPAAPFLGYLALGLLVFMAAFALFVISAGFR